MTARRSVQFMPGSSARALDKARPLPADAHRPGARVPAAGLVASATGSDLTGTWVGSYGWPGGSYWSDDGACTLQIDSVILRSSQGPSVTLVRDGDRLHGVARDPIVAVPITISFERERTAPWTVRAGALADGLPRGLRAAPGAPWRGCLR